MSKEAIELKTIEAQRKDAEEALEESESKYRFLVDNSKEIILILDKKAKIIFANKSTLSNFGYSQNELIGKPIIRFLAKDCIKKASYALFQEFLGHPQPEFEVQAKTKSGKIRYLRVAQGSVPVHEKGKLAGLMVSASDVTDHYKAGEELQASEKRFKELWDDAPVAYHILDTKGILIDVNQTETKMLGYAKEEMVGKSIFEFILPAQRAEAQRRFQQKILGQSISRAEDRIYVTKDGSEIHVDIDDVVERDKKGQIIGIRSTMLDVTGRKLAERKLGESEKRYGDLFDNVPIGLYRTSVQGQSLDINLDLVHLLGYPDRQSLLAANAADIYVDPRDRAQWQALMEKEGVVTNYEIRMRRHDGTVIWVKDNCRIVRDNEGRALYNEGSLEDITELKRTEMVQAAVYRISEASHAAQNLDELFSSVHGVIAELMPADNFFIALYDASADLLHFPYHVDEFDTEWFPIPPGKSLTGYVLKTGEPLLATPKVIEQLEQSGQVELIGTPSVDWLGAPLRTQRGETIGVMAIQTYSDAVRLGETEKGILVFVSAQAAMAIERKRTEEALQAEREQILSIFNSIDEIIYVSDPSSHKILYVNEALQRAIGRDPVGGVCYKEFQGLDHPCEFCTNEIILKDKGESYRWEFRNPILNRDFHYVDRIIKWPDGRDVRFEMAIDITERKKAEERLHQSMAQLRTTLKAAIKSLSSAIEMRDRYTVGHQERVTKLATAIAQEIGLLPEQIEGLQLAGIIHDIGKLIVPAEILSKPTKLTDSEYDMIKTHAEAGFKLLGNIEFPWPVAEIVYQHHECINGSGYPRGLMGKDILLEARILSVADVVEAMSSYRPYRPALGIEKALQEITLRKGTLYDAGVVDACIKLFSENRFIF